MTSSMDSNEVISCLSCDISDWYLMWLLISTHTPPLLLPVFLGRWCKVCNHCPNMCSPLAFRCRMYKELKQSYKMESYLQCNIRHTLLIYFTRFRLSSHRFLIERGCWMKQNIVTKQNMHMHFVKRYGYPRWISSGAKMCSFSYSEDKMY